MAIDATVEHMLTTIDNPYDPFTQFNDWYAFDIAQGYNTCALLARITISSSELSEYDQALAEEQAIDEILRENVTGIFKRVTRKAFEQQ